VPTAERVHVSATRPAPDAVARAVEALARGALIVYPTDTLYAIGGRAWEAAAAEAVRRAKGRGETKPLPLVAADVDQARGLCASWPPEAAALAARFWPGPLTLVLAADRALPSQVTAGSGTVAVRVPALELTRALCRGAGPLVSTSANRAGAPPAVTCEEALAAVGTAVALALDAGPGHAVVSTIVDLAAGAPRLLRAGAVPWDEIEGVLPPRGR